MKPGFVSFFNPARPITVDKLRFASAQKMKQSNYGESHEDDTRDKEEPDETLNHVFSFYISRAARTAARALLKHVATIATGLCAHRR